MIYATCLEEVGDPADRAAIGECIGGLEMETLAGFLTFDQETHLAIQGPEFYPIQFYQIWEGERIQIEPDKYATGSFQAPPWMDME